MRSFIHRLGEGLLCVVNGQRPKYHRASEIFPSCLMILSIVMPCKRRRTRVHDYVLVVLLKFSMTATLHINVSRIEEHGHAGETGFVLVDLLFGWRHGVFPRHLSMPCWREKP